MLAKLILGFIRFYQRGVSPFTPPTCRFTPTCSAYAVEAIESHGPGRGGWMAFKRLLRCHPLGGKGYDPVPAGSQEQGAEQVARAEGRGVGREAARAGRPSAVGADVVATAAGDRGMGQA